MSGLFNGTTARLLCSAVHGDTLPHAYSIWFKPSALTARMAALSTSRTLAGGSAQALLIYVAGHDAGPPSMDNIARTLM
jgi:hypothetical protein